MQSKLQRLAGHKLILLATLSLLLFSLLLAGCGGGGGASSESPSPEPPAPEPPTEILYTKVIDGYVSGANIFIDHNWNLIQDDESQVLMKIQKIKDIIFMRKIFPLLIIGRLLAPQSGPRLQKYP